MSKPVIIFGCSQISDMVFYDAVDHEDFKIVAFTVDTKYLGGEDSFLGLPLVDYATVEKDYPPDEYDMILLYTGFLDQRNRERLFKRIKEKGYLLRNYISPKADYAGPRKLGQNNVIMAGAHVGVNGLMGDNNLIRQNVYLGHDFHLGSHNVLGPGCHIGGRVHMEDLCYVGLGATVLHHMQVERESLVGAGAVVIHGTEPFSKNVGNPSRIIGYHEEEGIRMKDNREGVDW